MQAELAPKSYDAIMALHDTLSAPLRQALEEAGVADAAVRAALLQGAVNAGVQLVQHGMPAATVTAGLAAAVDGILRG